jgi:DNA-binding MarR family transcriptional regulator
LQYASVLSYNNIGMNKAQTFRELLIIFVRRFGLLNAGITHVCCGEKISIVQSHILYEINRQQNPSMQQIAEALGIDITTFSRQIKALEKKGLIEKRAHREDGRVFLLSLTLEGKRIKGKIDSEMNQYIEQILFQMSPFEQEMVIHAVTLLNESLVKSGKACTEGITCNLQPLKRKGKK